MNGLKSRITFTLAATLMAGMLMITLVIVTFWQQSLLRLQVQETRNLLLDITAPFGAKTIPPVDIKAALQNRGIGCGRIILNGTVLSFTDGNCEQGIPIEPLVRQAFVSGDSVTSFYGTTWAVASFQKRFLLAAAPLQSANKNIGALGVVIPLEPLWQSVRQHRKAVLVYILVNILLLTTIGFFRLARSIIKPIERLVQITSSYDSANHIPLLPDSELGEFRQLSTALQSMVAHIEMDRQKLRRTVESLEASNRKLQETQQEMIRTEKLASVGRLAAGLAHEIGNPIGIIHGYLELLQRGSLKDESRLEYSTRAMAELNRINRLIRQLLDFARSAPAGKNKIDIHSLLPDIIALLSNQKKMEDIKFTSRLDAEHSIVKADEEGLRQVLLNIVLNAVDAIKDKGTDFPGDIVVSTFNSEEKDNRSNIIITAEDNGCGIDPENLGNIFDPFFTTKEPGKGTGLGLSVSHSIIESAGGSIKAVSAPDSGTTISIILPTAEI